MKSKQLNFFALLADMDPILRKAEASLEVNYFQAGMFDDLTIR